MNTQMWEHPITAQQIQTLRQFGYRVIDPIVKLLACGDFGNGAMQEVDYIADYVLKLDISN